MNETPKYTVKPYLHGAELIMPDGNSTGFFANRLYGQNDGIRRAEVLAEALNERIELGIQFDAAIANNEAINAENNRLKKEVAELRAKVERYEAAFKSVNGTEAANE